MILFPLNLSNFLSTSLPFPDLSEPDITACFSQASAQEVTRYSMPAPLAAPVPQPLIITAPQPSIFQQPPIRLNSGGNRCVQFIRDIGIKEDSLFSLNREARYQEWNRLISVISSDLDSVKDLLRHLGWIPGVSGPITKGTLLLKEPHCYRVLVIAYITLIIRNSPNSMISLPNALARISSTNEELTITKDHAELLYHWSTKHLYEPAIAFIHSVNDYNRNPT